jgi:hypothetical protein
MDAERNRAILAACRDDPALFQTAVLGRELYDRQTDVCNAVATSPITVVPAGRAVGKSYLFAGLVIWWLFTRPYSLVITTGPDHRQVVSVLWKEIRRALRVRRDREGRRISPRIDLGYDHLTDGYSSPQRLVVREGTEWGALGFAAKTEEGFSGQHAGELLVIIDEASGVKDGAWTSIHGLAATKMIVGGNPIRYDCHFRELDDLAQAGSQSITSVRISSLDSPHAGLDHSPVGMASKSFLGQMREIHGENSPWWLSNILGQFPGKDSVSFIPRDWLDACTRPEILTDELWNEHWDGAAWLGIDPAGGVGADRSVCVVRNHKRILEVFASPWHGLLDDARHRLEPEILRLARKWEVAGDHVVFDKAGLGRSLGSYLEAEGLPGAVGYFGNGKGGKLYKNRRTANAHAFKNRIDARRAGFIPFYVDPGLPEWASMRQEIGELRAPTMEMAAGAVQQVLEDRESLKARLKRSPDLLDALFMTFTFKD